jgi:hypothetical protein
LAILLSILEPAIVNDENATIGIHIELIELLHDFISRSIDDYEFKIGGPKSAKSGKSGISGKSAASKAPSGKAPST